MDREWDNREKGDRLDYISYDKMGITRNHDK